MAGDEVAGRLALAALVSVLPPAEVDAALDRCGRVAQRVRTLPPWVTTYHVLASAIFPAAGYEQVTALLWSSLPAATGRGLARQLPSRGAVTRARARLGVEPFEVLLAELLAGPDAEHVYLQKLQTSSTGLWWVCDAGTGALRGCALRTDDHATPLRLVEEAKARAVVVCPPYDDASRALLEHLAASVAVSVGEMPVGFISPWVNPRVRSAGAWAQDALAQACVSVAQERALTFARDASSRVRN
jgi:Insertion element 4 transposase N-terminal